MPPVDRDNKKKPAGVLQRQQDKHFARGDEQLRIGNVRGKAYERIDRLEVEQAGDLIHDETAGKIDAEDFQQSGEPAACGHWGAEYSSGYQ
jgi:hypothetical protein